MHTRKKTLLKPSSKDNVKPLLDPCTHNKKTEATLKSVHSLLFLRRQNSPAKGQWWFPGGRIRKGETLEEALYREVKEETGLQVIKSERVNVYSRIFDGRHDITIAYLCNCKGDKIILNKEHTEYRYFKSLPKHIHPYLIQVIQDLRKKRNKRSS